MGVTVGRQVEDRLYVESENSCGYCGGRDFRTLTFHHLNHEDGDDKDNSYDNLLCLCHNCHHKYHQEKGILKEDLVNIKRRFISNTLTVLGVNALKVSYRNGVIAAPKFLMLHLIELGLLVEGQPHSGIDNDNGELVVMEASFHITDKGKVFYEKWFK